MQNVPDTHLAGYPTAGYPAKNSKFLIFNKPTNIFGRYFNLILYLVKRFWKKFALSKFATFVQQFNWISVKNETGYRILKKTGYPVQP